MYFSSVVYKEACYALKILRDLKVLPFKNFSGQWGKDVENLSADTGLGEKEYEEDC